MAVAAAFDTIERLNASVREIMKTASEDELRLYKRAVGHLMVELRERILDPLFEAHPDLLPPTWRDG